jgi:thiol-disulfide isomerase/thioredoxin
MMKRFTLALLYTAALALANPVVAEVSAAKALRSGDMLKLIFHPQAKEVGTAEFMTFEGDPLTLDQWKGKWVLLNFWATWCAPCREEMPMLSELQEELGSDSFEVLTIATSRNAPPKIKAFFDSIEVDNLPMHRDPQSALARQMAVLGLPVTVILNPEGKEVARLLGDADWASDNAVEVLKTLMQE